MQGTSVNGGATSMYTVRVTLRVSLGGGTLMILTREDSSARYFHGLNCEACREQKTSDFSA